LNILSFENEVFPAVKNAERGNQRHRSVGEYRKIIVGAIAIRGKGSRNVNQGRLINQDRNAVGEDTAQRIGNVKRVIDTFERRRRSVETGSAFEPLRRLSVDEGSGDISLRIQHNAFS
jgi:hypothetical protein